VCVARDHGGGCSGVGGGFLGGSDQQLKGTPIVILSWRRSIAHAAKYLQYSKSNAFEKQHN
jgi:hypothetical protein